MAAFEDEEDGAGWRHGDAARGGARDNDDHNSWDQDGPADADITPDDFGTIKCGWCKKFIFEDSVRCPYCKHLQLEQDQSAKARWIKVTAVVCIVAFGFWLIMGIIRIMSWLHQ